MLFWTLTFQTMLLQSYCHLLSRAKNPNEYVPREDLSFYPRTPENDPIKSYGEPARHSEVNEDYDVDEDPDPEDPEDKDGDDPDVTESHDSLAVMPLYRPTKRWGSNYNTGSKMDEVVYEYSEDTGWPTFTIKLVTTTRPVRKTSPRKHWQDLTRTINNWGIYPPRDRNKVMELRPLLNYGGDTTLNTGRRNSRRNYTSKSTAMITYSRHYTSTEPVVGKVYSDHEPALNFGLNSTHRKPDLTWLREGIAPKEQDSNFPVSVVMRSPITKRGNEMTFSTAGTPTRSITIKQNYKSTPSTVTALSSTPVSNEDEDSTYSADGTDTGNTTSNENNDSTSSAVLTESRTTNKVNDSTSTAILTPITNEDNTSIFSAIVSRTTISSQDNESTFSAAVAPSSAPIFDTENDVTSGAVATFISNENDEPKSSTVVNPTKTITSNQGNESTFHILEAPSRTTTSNQGNESFGTLETPSRTASNQHNDTTTRNIAVVTLIPNEYNKSTSTSSAFVTPGRTLIYFIISSTPPYSGLDPTDLTTRSFITSSSTSSSSFSQKTSTARHRPPPRLATQTSPVLLTTSYTKEILTAPPTAPDDYDEIKKITKSSRYKKKNEKHLTRSRNRQLRQQGDVQDERNWKCYQCGLDKSEYGDPSCYNVFQSGDFRVRYKRKQYKTKCEGDKRYIGGCFSRFLDISMDYKELGCRNWPPALGRSRVSKMYMKLEYLLRYQEKGCAVSPNAVLVRFSDSVELYARLHVCVCRGSYCNTATFHNHYYQCLLTFVFLLLVL